MKANIHKYERLIRVVLGAVMVGLAISGTSSMWFLVGFIPFLTGLIGWCPPYSMLGINTRSMKKED